MSLLQLPLSARQPSAQLTGVSVIQAQPSQLELADNPTTGMGGRTPPEAISPTRWYTTSRRATLDHWVLRWLPPDGRSRLSTVTVFSQAGEKTVAITDDYGGPSASSTCCR